jgi:hypothetical protein
VTLLILFFAFVLCFGFVLLVGAPYLPTQRKQADVALDLLNLKSGQTLYELGCGDGRVMLRAAERGIKSVGYELNPLLVIVARIVTWEHRKIVRVVWGNFWFADLSKADGVFVFLLERFMPKLDGKLAKEKGRKLSVVSYAFEIPGKKPLKSKNGMFLYRY